MPSGPITSWQIDAETMETVTDFIFLASKIIADGDCSLEIKRHLVLGRKAMTNLDNILKSRDITLLTKVYLVIVFPVVVYECELDHKENWALKNWCFWTMVLEKTLESPLDCKEIQPVNPKGYQPWIFIGRADAEAETPVLWPPDVKCWFIGEDWCWERLKAGREGDDRGQAGWMASLNGHEFEQAPGDGDGLESLACCSPRGHKELDTTERLNNNNALVPQWLLKW